MEIDVRRKGHLDIKKEDMLILNNGSFIHEDFSGRTLLQFSAVSSRFDNCNFTGLVTGQACFGGGFKDSEYVNCVFDNSRFSAPAPGNAKFVGCSFRNVVITDFSCRCVEFIDCVFSGKIVSGIFSGSLAEPYWAEIGRSVNQFHGNDFSGVQFKDISFVGGVDLSRQVLPRGEQYIYLPDALNTLNKIKASMPNAMLNYKDDFFRLFSIFEKRINAGQKGLFLNMDAFRRDSAHVLRLIKAFSAGEQ
jgi:hypothetical protein